MAFFISHNVMHLIKSAYYIALLWFSCPEQTHLSGVMKVMLEVLSKNCKKGLALPLLLLLLVETFIQVFHFTFYDRSHLHLTSAHTQHLGVGEIMKQPNDGLLNKLRNI